MQSKSNKSYTFEDWASGKIIDDYTNERIDGFDDRNLHGEGWLPKELYHKGFISEEEFVKIEDAQRDTYYKALEFNVQSILDKFQNRLNKAPAPEKLIKNKIERYEYEINESPYYVKDKVYSGEWFRTGVNSKAYRRVNDPEKLKVGGWFHFHNSIKVPSKSAMNNSVFSMAVNQRLIEELNTILKEYSHDTSYGVHQDNKKWVIETFTRIRPDFDSENKAVKKVKSLYKDKFSLVIGENTIRRYNGLID